MVGGGLDYSAPFQRAIVERLVDPGPPVRVSYRLTSRGRALQPVLVAVADWAESWLATAAAAVG